MNIKKLLYLVHTINHSMFLNKVYKRLKEYKNK